MKSVLITLMYICLSVGILRAQEQKQEVTTDNKLNEVKVSIKDGTYTVVYIDGVKYDPDILELLDQDKIESVEILKGDTAKKKYGAQAVFIVSSKMKSEKKDIYVTGFKDGEGENQIRIRQNGEKKSEFKFHGPDNSGKPLVYVDGVLQDEEALKKISPEKIKSISVLKGEKAKKKYNTSSGAILVTLMK